MLPAKIFEFNFFSFVKKRDVIVNGVIPRKKPEQVLQDNILDNNFFIRVRRLKEDFSRKVNK